MFSVENYVDVIYIYRPIYRFKWFSIMLNKIQL